MDGAAASFLSLFLGGEENDDNIIVIVFLDLEPQRPLQNIMKKIEKVEPRRKLSFRWFG